MKTLILFLTLSFLMNCYTYRTVTSENTDSGYNPASTYELQLNDDIKVMAKNLVKDGETYRFAAVNGTQRTLSAGNVKLIRERTYDRKKTTGLTLGIIVGAAAIAVAIGSVMFSGWDMNWTE